MSKRVDRKFISVLPSTGTKPVLSRVGECMGAEGAAGSNNGVPGIVKLTTSNLLMRNVNLQRMQHPFGPGIKPCLHRKPLHTIGARPQVASRSSTGTANLKRIR